MLVTPAGVTAARLPERVHGNTAGAGDAVVAALARAFADRGADLLDDPAAARVACADAVAVSAAAVRAPVAGEVDPADVAEFAAAVQIVEP
jgi:fructose-1-phosphate kinase PfkB-like protein